VFTPLVVAAILLVIFCFFVGPFLPDDSYISYRYAENLVDRGQLVFNPGEPLEAYSNFLWIMVCAALYAMGMSLPVVTPVLGALLTLAGLLLLWQLARERIDHPAQLYLPLLAYALSAPLVLYTIGGMESALFGFWLMAMIYGADRVYRAPALRWWTLLGGAGFLLSITRPEGVVALPVMLVWMVWDSRRDEQRTAIMRGAALWLAAFVVLYGVYTAWRVSYFGEWLPTPFWSKGYDAFPILTAWHKNFRQYFEAGYHLEAPSGYYFVALFLLGAAGLTVAPGDDGPRRTDRLALVTALVMAVLYINFVDWMPKMRYHVPLIGLLCLPIVRLGRLLPKAAWPRTLRSPLGVFLAVVLLLGAYGMERVRAVSGPMTLGRVDCTIPLGHWLARVLPPGSTIAIGDVGVVPYFSGMRTVDIHPESLTDRHIVREGISVDYMMQVHPDAVIINVRGVYTAKMNPTHYEFYHEPEFAQEYRFIGTVRQQWYFDRSYWVFIHESIPLSSTDLTSFPTGIGTQVQLGFSLHEPGGRQ
jgi:hypothetical protein